MKIQVNSLKQFFQLCLIVLSLLFTITSCTENDDIQCGDELHPCDEIVADEIVNG